MSVYMLRNKVETYLLAQWHVLLVSEAQASRTRDNSSTAPATPDGRGMTVSECRVVTKHATHQWDPKIGQLGRSLNK